MSEDSPSPEDSDGEELTDEVSEELDNPPADDDEADSEDPFPEDTPTAIRQRVQVFQNRLLELGVNVRAISSQREEPEDDADEDEQPLESLALQCQYNRANFLVIFPVEEQFALFQADYDVLEDMVYSSPHDELGGDFEDIQPQARWEAHQAVRQQITPEQVVGLCRENRGIPIPHLEAWFSFLRTASDKFTVETTRVQFEYIGAAAHRRMYTNPNNLTTQELYDTVSQLLSLRQAIQDILGGTYVLNGVDVPDNFETLHTDVEEDPRGSHEQPYNKGFQ